MTATATPGTVQVDVGFSENVTILSNAVGNVQGPTSSASSVTMTSSNVALPLFEFKSGWALPITFRNITLNGGVNSTNIVMYWSGFSVGSMLNFSNVNIIDDNNTGLQVDAVINAANSILADRLFINITGSPAVNRAAFRIGGNITTAASMKFTNSIFRCPAQNGINESGSASANKILVLDHCGIYDSLIGLANKAGASITNTSFLNNGTDFSSTGANGVTTDMVTCEFGQLASGATSSFYGQTLALKFSNRARYTESTSDPNKTKGTTSLDGTPDFYGRIWNPQTNCIGPIGYVVPQGWGIGR